MATKVKKPRKQRVKRQTKVEPVQIDLLRQGDFEVGFRPNLRPIQQASLLGNLLTNVSNQEKLSALSASLKQYEKQLEESKRSPTIVTTAEEVKPLTLSSTAQVGRLRDIKFVQQKKNAELEAKKYKGFEKQFGLETTLEEELDLTGPFEMELPNARIAVPPKSALVSYNPPPMSPFLGRPRPLPLATLQRASLPELPSSSRQITKEEVMADVRRENVDLRSAQRNPFD